MASDLPDTAVPCDGTFDNQATGRREVWQDGRLRRYAQRRAVGYSGSPWREMDKPWGSYPDLPTNVSQHAGA